MYAIEEPQLKLGNAEVKLTDVQQLIDKIMYSFSC